MIEQDAMLEYTLLYSENIVCKTFFTVSSGTVFFSMNRTENERCELEIYPDAGSYLSVKSHDLSRGELQFYSFSQLQPNFPIAQETDPFENQASSISDHFS